jgi:hypothetical protein
MYRLSASRRVESGLRQENHLITYLLQKFMSFQDCLLQEQGPGMEKWSVSKAAATFSSTKPASISETDLDDVLQINNVFTNVSKGEVAKHDDLKKAFGKMDTDDVVKEVRDSATCTHIAHLCTI